MTPMPSPRGTNHANAYIVRQRVPVDLRGLAHDEDPNGRLKRLVAQRLANGDEEDDQFAGSRADLVDVAKEREFGEDDEEELNGRRALLASYLRGKGMSEDDIRQACDLLGPQESALRGGAPAGNFGGALHGSTAQPSGSPSSRDACLEEELGHEPSKDFRNRRMDGRDARRFGRDSGLGFDQLYGLVGPGGVFASQPRRRRSERAMANDAAASEIFERMFPEGRRIGTSEHDFTRR
jgi:hypothetical protein